MSFNVYVAGLIPRVPEKGTVGASGDLAPLAHIALACIAEGEFWDMEAHSWVEAGLVSTLFSANTNFPFLCLKALLTRL